MSKMMMMLMGVLLPSFILRFCTGSENAIGISNRPSLHSRHEIWRPKIARGGTVTFSSKQHKAEETVKARHVAVDAYDGFEEIMSPAHSAQQTTFRRRSRQRSKGQIPKKARMEHDDGHGSRELQAVGANLICNSVIPQEEEAGIEFGTQCVCTPDQVAGTSTLLCTDMECGYCNDANTVCERYSYGVVFDGAGNDIAYIEQDEYIAGKSETLTFKEDENGCSMKVDNTMCNSCRMVDCGDGYYGINMNCMNIPTGAMYDSCQGGFYTEGVLQAYNENDFGYCSTSRQVCERDADIVEDGRFDCSCADNENQPGVSTLGCEDGCQYCSDDFRICGLESYYQTYVSGVLEKKTKAFQFNAGRSEEVTYEESDCIFSGCRSCTIQVDGVECNHCSMQTCPDGELRPFVNCDNIETGARANFCLENRYVSSLLDFLSPDFADGCAGSGELACADAITGYEENEQGFVCSCLALRDGGTQLTCDSTCGDLCNEENDVCVRESFVKNFSVTGITNYFKKEMQYTVGRRETLGYEEFIDGTCRLSVDGRQCSSCSIQTCPDGSSAPYLDCTNIDPIAQLDLCDKDLRMEEGVFERFSMNEFTECVDRAPTNMVCATAARLSSIGPATTSGSTILVNVGETKPFCAEGGSESMSSGLWYSFVGAGRTMSASICQEETDFDAAISVYSGVCASLTCVSGTTLLDSCNATWVAERDVEYHIQIHGHTLGESGNFELLVSEVNVAPDSCTSLLESMESIAFKDYSCTCNHHGPEDPSTLQCENGCVGCERLGGICATETDDWNIGVDGNVYEMRRMFQYDVGRTESIIVEQRGCVNGDNCEECSVSIDGSECESCSVVACPGRNAGHGMQVSCRIPGETGVSYDFNTCRSSSIAQQQEHLQNGPFAVLLDDSFGVCFSQDPWASCAAKKSLEESTGNNNETICTCEENDAGDAVVLSCREKGCLLCNEARTTCGHRAFGASYNVEQGTMISSYEGFAYVDGRNDVVTFQTSAETGNSADTTCVASINNTACNECRRLSCDAEGITDAKLLQYEVSCGNLLEAHEIVGCDPTSTGFVDAFEFMGQAGFLECVAVPDPDQVCQDAMDSISSPGRTCSCEAHNDGLRLVCSDSSSGCQYCDETGSICASYTEYGAMLNRLGSFVSYWDTFDYVRGRDETLVVEDSGIHCTAMIDGIACGKCELVDCPGQEVTSDVGGGPAIQFSIDCSDVLGYKAEYECGEGDPIFSALSGNMYHVCPGDGFFDTSSPSSSPSLPSSSMPTSLLDRNETANSTEASGEPGAQIQSPSFAPSFEQTSVATEAQSNSPSNGNLNMMDIDMSGGVTYTISNPWSSLLLPTLVCAMVSVVSH